MRSLDASTRRSGTGFPRLVAVAGLLWVATTPALASGPPAAPPPTGTGAHDATGSSGPPAIAGIGTPVATRRLDGLRGGDGTTTNLIDVDGDVSGNSAQDIASGMNLVDGGSFGNAAGVSTVIQNSGSNVLIQNAMIVNVQFADPTP